MEINCGDNIRLSFIRSCPRGVRRSVKWILSKLGAIKLHDYLRLKPSFENERKNKRKIIPNRRV